MESTELKNLLECLLFVAAEPLDEARLSALCEAPAATVHSLLEELRQEYQGRGFGLRQIAGGWQFFSQPAFLPFIEKLYRPKMAKLSKAGLETLAIIAYKQPITRQEVENIRKVGVDSVISTLLEKDLIQEVGRRNVPGRPILYGTTDAFLAFFGINSLDELPAPQTDQSA